MIFNEKQREAAKAIAAANPTWSQRHVEMCASFLMPTSNACYFDPGTRERAAAEQQFKERMSAFLVEMNIIKPEQAYHKPDDWQSPYKPEKPARQPRQQAPRAERTEAATNEAPRVVAEIREPRPGSAGAQAWAVCDRLFQELNRVPSGAEARAAGEAAGLNPGNVSAEISRWAKFRGHRK